MFLQTTLISPNISKVGVIAIEFQEYSKHTISQKLFQLHAMFRLIAV